MLTEENLADFVDRRLNPQVRARRCARSSRGEIGGDSGRRGCELPFRQRHLKRRVKHRERKRKKTKNKDSLQDVQGSLKDKGVQRWYKELKKSKMTLWQGDFSE